MRPLSAARAARSLAFGSALAGSSAWGGSLDLSDPGGLWATPTSSDPMAVFWNPGALGAGRGTRVFLEGSPILGHVGFDRTEGTVGREDFRFVGLAPTLGIATDAGVDGLGLGLSFLVPVARGATSTLGPDADGPARSHLRGGMVQSLQLGAAVSYQILDRVSLGASVSYALGSWNADLDLEYVTSLASEIGEITGLSPTDLYPDDAVFEDPAYSTRLGFGPLWSHDVTFGFGLHARPHDQVELGVSYQHGWTAEHRGSVTLDFACPPSTDILGRFGAEDRGLCGAAMTGGAVITQRYPSRVYGGVAVLPTPDTRVEIMGGWVHWSVFQDYAILVTDVQSTNTTISDDTASLVGQDRRWARDNRDSWSIAVDAKARVADRFRVGGRVGYDAPAVPDATLSPNNYDAHTLSLGVLGGVQVSRQVEIGVTFQEYIGLRRETTSSAFGVTLSEDRNADRYFFPSMAGGYGSQIHRFGVHMRATFDGSARETRRRARDAADGQGEAP